ncbi:hypothetical protein CEXT_647481 [Caerostris extrusa]|uniref:Uncharacterized protein n=1 Tax=Caerostris extrusa TaxID=172846 RepID=A0AAV4NYM3_CAEEX|nr:hypothetical protein CEXT_647481 [Caerostris extrusa]
MTRGYLGPQGTGSDRVSIGYEASKTMVRCHTWDRLKPHMEREKAMLCYQWLKPECQERIKKWLSEGMHHD